MVVAPVTVIEKLPVGVETPCGPPHPASAKSIIMPANANVRRSFVFLLLRPLKTIATSPNAGNASAAYRRGFGPSKRWLVNTLLALPEVVRVMVTVESGRFVAGGLNTQAVPTGKPLQPKATIPRVESSSSTSKTNVAGAPAFTLELVECGVRIIGGPRLTGSEAVLLPVLVSPPPETVAVLVKLFWMLMGMFTVKVIGG